MLCRRRRHLAAFWRGSLSLVMDATASSCRDLNYHLFKSNRHITARGFTVLLPCSTSLWLTIDRAAKNTYSKVMSDNIGADVDMINIDDSCQTTLQMSAESN